MTIKCPYCNKQPHEISEYRQLAAEYNQHMKPGHEVTPEEIVIGEEGTYDSATKLFTCTSCYIKIGQPLMPKLKGAYEVYRREVEPLEQ